MPILGLPELKPLPRVTPSRHPGDPRVHPGFGPAGMNAAARVPEASRGRVEAGARGRAVLLLPCTGEILRKEGEMSSFEWHLNPLWGLSQKQNVNSAAERWVES